jgi:hypothetical protein
MEDAIMDEERQKILDAIETSMFMLNKVEGVYERYNHPSLNGYIWKGLDFEEFNRVGMARLQEEQLDDTIQEVIDTYTRIGRTKIGWHITPQSTPNTLPEALERHGFTLQEYDWGMVRDIQQSIDFSITDKFEFKVFQGKEILPLYDDPKLRRKLEIAYGMPEGTADILKLGAIGALHLENFAYLAYDKSNDELVGYGGVTYIPNSTMALLSGAATLPEYRKRGIYSSLIKLRYEKAKSDGLTHLIIQAKEHTSAPIAAKFGFEKMCEIPFYVWDKNK